MLLGKKIRTSPIVNNPHPIADRIILKQLKHKLFENIIETPVTMPDDP
jgi:hypothetical protein